MRTGFTLRHARTAPARRRSASRAPSPSRLRGPLRARRRGTRPRPRRRRSRSRARGASPTSSRRGSRPVRASGRSSRSSPSRCSTSKKNADERHRVARRRRRVPKRLIVSWKRCGTGVVVDADRLAVEHERVAPGTPRTTSTTSGRRSVTSLRLRVKTRTSSPGRCTWMRAPSSFHSTDASPVFGERFADRRRARREHRLHRPQHLEADGRERVGAARRARRRAVVAEIAAEHRGAAHRRRPERRRPRAIASAMSPASAPWRSSPVSSRTTKSASAARRAREQRRASTAWRAPRRPGAGRRLHARRSPRRGRRRSAVRRRVGARPRRAPPPASPSRCRRGPGAARR